MVVLAGTCDRAALLTDYVIAEKVSGKISLFFLRVLFETLINLPLQLIPTLRELWFLEISWKKLHYPKFA